MGLFLKGLVADLRSPVPWVLWLTISMAVAVAGPFGSYGALTVSQRVLFWTPVIGIAVLVGTLIRAFVYGPLKLHGRLLGAGLIALMTSAVLSPSLYILFNAMFPPVFSAFNSLMELVLLVISLSLGVCALRISAEPEGDRATPVAASVKNAPNVPHEPRLIRRLEADKRGAIWAISVRDHYVDVQTSLAKSSLLMRFSDAIAEVDCVPGAQVHRSHWVAWEGVGSVCREGGKMIVHLKNGHQIPVSRLHRDKVDAQFPLTEAVTEVQGAA